MFDAGLYMRFDLNVPSLMGSLMFPATFKVRQSDGTVVANIAVEVSAQPTAGIRVDVPILAIRFSCRQRKRPWSTGTFSKKGS